MCRAGETLDRSSRFEGREQPLGDEEAVLDRQGRPEEARGEKVVERASPDVQGAQERDVVDGAHHRPACDRRALDVVYEVHGRLHRGQERGPVDRGRRERADEKERFQPGRPRRSGPPDLTQGVRAKGVCQDIRPERPRARCGGAHELFGNGL